MRVQDRVADPDVLYPDSTFEKKKLDSDSTVQKNDPDLTLGNSLNTVLPKIDLKVIKLT